MTAPIIGLTCWRRDVASSPGPTPMHTATHYDVAAVAASGGVPVVLPAIDPALADGLVARLDGLVLTGGGDVEPARYGGEGHDTVYGVDPARDSFEAALVHAARSARLPTLALCRGLQITNVTFGGTLVADVPSQVPGAVQHARRGPACFEAHQTVRVEHGSRLAKVLDTGEVRTNSIHHQAVDRIAAGFRAVAWSTADGVVEGVECTDEGWPMLAVQWHPEYLAAADNPYARRLYDWFIATASR